jgi:predicted dehydrogenase
MRRRDGKLSRRQFTRRAAAGAALFTIVPRHVLGGQEEASANDKLNIAVIGVGGRGAANLKGLGDENIVGLCDVDDRQASKSFEKFPQAKRFRDFRKMLDELDKQIDAVVVATPDHTHAVACLDALQRGKHLYCEKPLAHSVYEVRQVMKAAREAGVVTQLGNQGHSSEAIRRFCEWIWDGAIGNVTEVHAACSQFKDVYCQIDNLVHLDDEHDLPEGLDWDLWLGPARWRPYHPMYVPWNWRGWLPFGTGAIGDWVCHVVDPVFWALDLGAPSTIQAEVDKDYHPENHKDVYPAGVAITFEFPAKGDRGPVKLIWYDGNKTIPHPADLEPERKPPGTGAVVIGDKGTITHGSHGAGGVRIVPETKMREYQQPEPSIPRVSSHHGDWLQGIREGKPAGSNFDYGGRLTELALLGVIAIRIPGTKLEWDAENMKFTNCDAANQYVKPTFREGWSV